MATAARDSWTSEDWEEKTARWLIDEQLLRKEKALAEARYSPIELGEEDFIECDVEGAPLLENSAIALAPRFISRLPEAATSTSDQYVEKSVLRELGSVLAEFIGPAALPVLRGEIRQLGQIPESFPSTKMSVLIGALTRRMDTEETRDAFLALCSSRLKKKHV
jgi:hypothetical protein